MKTFVLLVVYTFFLVAHGHLRASIKDFVHSKPTRIKVESPQSTQIAVEVNGGHSEAESVANKCGLVNRGKVNKYNIRSAGSDHCYNSFQFSVESRVTSLILFR